MDPCQLEKIAKGRLLDVIRVRTAMYTGERTLTAVAKFLEGYIFSLMVHGLSETPPLPNDIHEWVAYRLHFFEATRGYKRMILDREPNEEKALDLFFSLLDEHESRKANIVARIEGCTALTLVTYTNDPGFFIRKEHESAGAGATLERFCATVDDSRMSIGTDGANLTIFDQVTYCRLVQETERYKAGIRELLHKQRQNHE